MAAGNGGGCCWAKQVVMFDTLNTLDDVGGLLAGSAVDAGALSRGAGQAVFMYR